MVSIDQQGQTFAGQTSEPFLKLQDISKMFPGVKALTNVSITINRGEVHALVGENGAGKSTLMKIIVGEYQPDHGVILMANQEVAFHSPSESAEAGIRLIHQHFPLAADLSVGENIYMNKEPVRGPLRLVDWNSLHSQAQEILDQLELGIDSHTIVGELSVSQRQLVEIAKALAGEAQIIIMDEPTSALGEEDTERLFGIIERLKREGISIIYVSHKLDEVFRVGDRVTVLRDGQVIGTRNISSLSADELVTMMVGRSLDELYPYAPGTTGDVILEVTNLSLGGKLNNISLQAKRGEILGITGLVGSGLTELAECIFGLIHPSAGEIRVDGQIGAISNPNEAIKVGIMLVPHDRWHTGLCLGLSLRENISLSNLDRVTSKGFIMQENEINLVNTFKERLSIIAASNEMLVSHLSGGNQQKVVLAKSLGTHPRILLLDSPTVGIDVGSKAEIYKILSTLAREENVAIIVFSTEIPEIIGICDRILVLRKGCLQEEFLRGEASKEDIRMSMSGLAAPCE